MDNVDFAAKALEILESDAERIMQLIRVQRENLVLPNCPLYQEVLDTQMFGLSREVDFAVRLGLISREEGKRILYRLEEELARLDAEVARDESVSRPDAGCRPTP